MSYRLNLVTASKTGEKDFGEDVIFDNLPSEYELYLFYYSGPIRNSSLEQKLKEYGGDVGKNLFINVTSPKDPKYKLLARYFEIDRLPAIIITGVNKIASIEDGNQSSTAFARIDNRELLKDENRTLECIGNLFSLFMTGKVTEALKEAKSSERKAVIAKLTNSLLPILKGLVSFLKENDVSFSLFEGKLEIKQKEK